MLWRITNKGSQYKPTRAICLPTMPTLALRAERSDQASFTVVTICIEPEATELT
jgi:hypothetical protein